MSQNFITSSLEYQRVYAKLSETFDLDRELPDQVFRGPLGRCAFLEFDAMLSRAFGSILDSLATNVGDTEVYVTVLDPDPEGYYFSHFHRYGAFQLKTPNVESDYFADLSTEPEGSPADALLYNANVITMIGNTRSWAIWGERDLGIGVLAIRNGNKDRELWRSTQTIKCFDVESAISDIVALNFPGQVTPSHIAAKLRTHYGVCR